ncbi:MAG TPA: ABC transporter permease [Chloroflexota bacterium]|nr:ABC transporter permease [Chloroflexota bacterium]
MSVQTPPTRRRRRLRGLLIAGGAACLFILVAIVGPLVVTYDPITTHIADRLKPPFSTLDNGTLTIFGTDQVGRDLLPQILQGARISLLVGLATVTAAGLIGLAAGVLAGFYGGALDAIVMRLADIQLGFPTILLAILIAAVLGPSVTNVIITLSLTRWVTFGRVARAATLTTREREYVLAARALGCNHLRLLWHHVMPATLAALIVIATVEVGLVIVAEASLSFLGLGTPPDQPSWGLIVANGRAYINTAWWISTLPGAALSLVVIAVGNLGDQLRDYLDPRTSIQA